MKFTNEQRAHDIAITLLNSVIEAKKQEVMTEAIRDVEDISEGTIVTKPIHMYAIYKELYDDVLNGLNRDYPVGH